MKKLCCNSKRENLAKFGLSLSATMQKKTVGYKRVLFTFVRRSRLDFEGKFLALLSLQNNILYSFIIVLMFI